MLCIQPPENIEGRWQGVLNAYDFGNKCLQLIGQTVEGNEDCLYLNIYVPSGKSCALIFSVSIRKFKLFIIIFSHKR